MHIYTATSSLGILLLGHESCCPFALCCSSLSALPFCSREAKRFLPSHHTLSTLWKLLFPRPVHIALARYQNPLTNGRLSGNTDKNFKHVLYLLGVQCATLRWGLPSNQAGLGIQLQNRRKENTFPLRKKLDNSAACSRLSSLCAIEELGMVCAFSRLQFPPPTLFSKGVMSHQPEFYICQPLKDAEGDFNPFHWQPEQPLYTPLLPCLRIQEYQGTQFSSAD